MSEVDLLRQLSLLPRDKLLLVAGELSERLRALEDAQHEPVAVVGLSCRFAGGIDTPESFWTMLAEGGSPVRELPAGRRGDAEGPPIFGSFFEAIDGFDAAFFGISPREAMRMDPQQRLLLELAWQAIEDAGLTRERLAGGRTGVFAALCDNFYSAVQFDPTVEVDAYSGLGASASALAGRLSYLLNVRGPSLAIDTACSSSLVALHLALRSLRAGESDVAIVGGANLAPSTATFAPFIHMGLLSASGACRTFDSQADGFVCGEGGGALVLKRLSDALADGDTIHAVVRGSAVNHCGRSAGLSAPNGTAQAEVIRAALDDAGVAPERVSYIEAHGTATRLGDPIEVEALGQALGRLPAGQARRLIGSVKANLGHLGGAAGMAGLIKVVMMLRHGAVPPHRNFACLNPEVRFEEASFAIVDRLTPWPAADKPRIVGISGFGWAGTNAHAILEAAPSAEATTMPGSSDEHALLLSARSHPALRELAERHAAALTGGRAAPLADWCYTAACHRTAQPHRLAVVGRNAEELASSLKDLPAGQAASSPEVVFIFPGQGSQWVGMGRELLKKEPVFSLALEACDAAIRDEARWSVMEALASGEGLDRIEVVQPVLFALQVALAAQWRSWGVEPVAVIGHSMGEVAAAYVSGALPLASAVRVICRRSRLMSRLGGRGAMALIELDLSAARALASHTPGVEVAASNGPRLTVLSGEAAAIAAVVADLEAAGTFARLVPVEVASHSAQVDPILGEVLEALSGVESGAAPGAPAVAMWSTVTGEAVASSSSLDAAYWVKNLRQPVLLAPVVEQLAATGEKIFLEVSPHPVLVTGLQETVRDRGMAVGSMRRGEGERAGMLRAAAAIWQRGGEVDWEMMHGRGRVVALPAYPWQHERYWLERSKVAPRPQADLHPLLGRSVDWADDPTRRGWENTLSLEHLPYLRDHRVANEALMPAAAYLEMALAAAGKDAVSLRDVRFLAPLFLAEDARRRVQLLRDADGRFRIFARDVDSWAPIAEGWIDERVPAVQRFDLPAFAVSCPRELSPADHYSILARQGVEDGPAFQLVTRLRLGEGRALATLAPVDAAGYRLHPALLDACLQTMAAAFAAIRPPESDGEAGIIVELGAFSVLAPGAPRRAVAELTARAPDGRQVTGIVHLLDETGVVLARIDELVLRLASRTELIRRSGRLPDSFMQLDWEPLDPLPVPAAMTGDWLVVGKGALATSLEEALGAARAATAGDVTAVIHDRFDAGRRPCQGVVFVTPSDSGPLLEAQRQSCGALIDIARLLLAGRWRDMPRLWTITRGAVAALADETIDPAQGPMWGLVRSLMHEHPELDCGLLDVDPDVAPVIETLAALLRGQMRENQIRLRGGAAHVARLACIRDTAAHAVAVRSDGTYLVAGGLGGIGLAVARWLAERGAGRIVLLGRRSPDAATQAVLAGLNADIVVCQVDIADADALAAVLAKTTSSERPLRGIVNAAGLLADGLLLGQSRADFEAPLAPKLAGSWNLHHLTAPLDLDFFVLFSSVTGVLGSPGQANYAAANAYLDALALHRRQLGLPATSIAWCPWAEVGMAAADAQRGERLKLRGMASLSPAEGIAYLEMALRTGLPQLVILPIDMARWREFYPALAEAPLFAHLDRAGQQPASAAPVEDLRALPPADRRKRVETHVRAVIAKVMRLAPRTLPDQTPLGELGLDSMMGLEIRNHLDRLLGLRMPASLVWFHPTIAALSDKIAALLDDGAAASDVLAAPTEAAAPADDLTEHELADLLSAELDDLKRRRGP